MSEEHHHGPPSVEPEVVKKIVYGLYVACAAVAASDFFYHKHGHYDFEQWPAFHAGYGWLSCVVLVVLAAQMRKVVMRDEEYYERD
jgi:hypothetical protein